MRKVKFNKWIPRVLDENRPGHKKEGTACWEDGYPNTGLFHGWGVNYEEGSEGFGNYTIALVEQGDGTIEPVFPFNLKFESETASEEFFLEKEKNVKVIESSRPEVFENALAIALQDGWKLQACSCGFVNSEKYEFCSSYQAVLTQGV